MRKLTQAEIDYALDDNGESENGYIAIEATMGELALKGTGTSCGIDKNIAFVALGVLFPDNATRLVRGWYDPSDNIMGGMIHIQCDDDEVAEKISEVAYEAGNGGSLRSSGESLWETFWEFESE